MTTTLSRNIRLGVFVLVSTVVLVASLYFIGNKRNLFGGRFRISASFYNVSGLMKGNNVRFGGIDVGTVDEVVIVSDTSVNVVMVISNDVQKFIRTNALASVGTDGLMGNKLINIYAMPGDAPIVKEGDVLRSLRPLETNEMMRTLNSTNENVKTITDNLKTLTNNINNPKSLWGVLMDTSVAENVRVSLANFRLMSERASSMAADLKKMTSGINTEEGLLALLKDTTMSRKIKHTVKQIQQLSDSAHIIASNLTQATGGLNKKQSLAGTLLHDTSLSVTMNRTLNNLEQGAANFNENMEALKHVWPFKKYYKKKEKQK